MTRPEGAAKPLGCSAGRPSPLNPPPASTHAVRPGRAADPALPAALRAGRSHADPTALGRSQPERRDQRTPRGLSRSVTAHPPAPQEDTRQPEASGERGAARTASPASSAPPARCSAGPEEPRRAAAGPGGSKRPLSRHRARPPARCAIARPFRAGCRHRARAHSARPTAAGGAQPGTSARLSAGVVSAWGEGNVGGKVGLESLWRA